MSDSTNAVRAQVAEVGFQGKSLHSINDLSNDQIYAMFELAKLLEPYNRSGIDLIPHNVMAAVFFQPSTRTRLSFETAMHRLGGRVITEANPMVTSSAAKEETLADMMQTVSRYANLIVLRHPDDVAAREGVVSSIAPVINGGWGHWEHPTQALFDLYTLWRTTGRVEGANVVVASPDMIAARTGHSMARGLARLGANLTIASTSEFRTPDEIMADLSTAPGLVDEVLDLSQEEFNELVADMDLIYLPGCSAPKGAEADAFKKIMDDYYVRLETLTEVEKTIGRTIRLTHTLPRRAGEMDLRIDSTPHQQYFESLLHSVSLRMALVASILVD